MVVLSGQALMAARARYLMGQLQSLGWADWQCAPALLAHGSDLAAALAFLLEERIASPAQAQAFMAAAAGAPDIDVAEELAMVAQAQVWVLFLREAHPSAMPEGMEDLSPTAGHASSHACMFCPSLRGGTGALSPNLPRRLGLMRPRMRCAAVSRRRAVFAARALASQNE